MAAYETPEMKEFLDKNPDAKIAVDQLDLRQALVRDLQDRAGAQGAGGRGQAVLNGKKQPKEALVAAQKAADEMLRPYDEQTSLKLPRS